MSGTKILRNQITEDGKPDGMSPEFTGVAQRINLREEAPVRRVETKLEE